MVAMVLSQDSFKRTYCVIIICCSFQVLMKALFIPNSNFFISVNVFINMFVFVESAKGGHIDQALVGVEGTA